MDTILTKNNAENDRKFTKKFINILLILLMLFIAIYGLFAIDMGRVNLLPMFDGDEASRRLQMYDDLNRGKITQVAPEEVSKTGLWLAIMSKLTSDRYVYGQDLAKIGIHYAKMPDSHKLVIIVHNILGGMALLIALLQLWPTFRHRHLQLHRRIGVVHVIFVQIAMLMSMVYLLITPIETVYAGLPFYAGLWGLAVMTSITLWCAVYAVYKKQLAQHQAFMALNFGLLLTAPLLRYDWMLVGMVYPNLTQYYGNWISLMILGPQSVLTGYLFLLINRAQQRDKPQILQVLDGHVQTIGKIGVMLLIPIVIYQVWALIHYYWMDNGLQNSVLLQQYAPSGLLANEINVLEPLQMWRHGLVITGLVALFSALGFMWQAFVMRQSNDRKLLSWGLMMSSFSLLYGLMLWVIGQKIGIAGDVTQTGGAVYLCSGIFLIVVALAMLICVLRGNLAYAKEWGAFTLAALLTPMQFYMNLAFIDVVGMSSTSMAKGYGYILAIILSSTLFMVASFYCAYSQANLRKIAY